MSHFMLKYTHTPRHPAPRSRAVSERPTLAKVASALAEYLI